MTIREQVEDASFLAHNGRYIGALTTLMLAVAASARKTFPKGTQSYENPEKKMSDRESFTLFLGGRIRKILFGDHGGPDKGASGISVNFRGAQHDLAYILYKYYRCELVHDGELPEDVEFNTQKQPGVDLNTSSHGLQVSISTGNKMVLDRGWINLLLEAVINARCNSAEFGREHFDLVPIPGVDEAMLLESLVEKYETSPGRVQILKNVVRKLSPEAIIHFDNSALAKSFSALVESQEINGGAITGLRNHGFTDDRGVLLQRGGELIRDIASKYQLVAVP